MANPYYAYGAYGYGQVQTYQSPPVAPAPVAPAPAQPYSQYYQQPQTPQQSNYYYAIVTSQQQTPGTASPAVVTSGTYAAYQSHQTPGRGRGTPAVGRVAGIGPANGGGQGQIPQGGGGRGRGFARGRGGFARGRGGFGRGGLGYDSGQAASNVSPIDAAVLSVAQSYMAGSAPTGSNAGASAGKRWPKPAKPAVPNPNAEMKYCETCKVSCVGAQAFNDHLNGKLHKKKEEQAKRGGAAAPVYSRGQKQLHCELCDVSCIGTDSYDAHVRGIKHQKVLKLYQTLGKPIPASEPTLMQTTVPDAATGGAVVKKLAVPKMAFVGGTQLKSTASGLAEEKTVAIGISAETEQAPMAAAGNYVTEPEVQPIGEEYVEAVVSNTGHVVRFHCKLCVCDFNDENARLLHLKGRRHRQTYKQKVDPSLQIEPDSKARRMEVKRAGTTVAKVPPTQRSPAIVPSPRGPVMPLLPPGPAGLPLAQRRPETMNDRYIMAKHASIYPNDDELQVVQSLVMTCEKALKLVSDHLVESDTTASGETTSDVVPPLMSSTATGRVLKGVMRVGVLAKGLIMRDDPNVHLLILCAGKPTLSLLNSIYTILPDKLAEVSAETFETAVYPEEAAFVVAMSKEPRATCTVTLTSPVMRQENLVEGADAQSNADPADMLDRQKCLDALAALRHAKWFQAKATPLPSCVIVIRILQDMCRRVPAWHALSQWAVELLVERCLTTGEPELSPSLALRRVFEAISSGLLLPGGPGVLDPCEKESVDALELLSNQEREDITASAQQALRMMTMQQLYKVLDIEPMGGKMPLTPVPAPDTTTTTDAAVKRPPPGNSTMGGEVKKIKTDDEQA